MSDLVEKGFPIANDAQFTRYVMYAAAADRRFFCPTFQSNYSLYSHPEANNVTPPWHVFAKSLKPSSKRGPLSPKFLD